MNNTICNSQFARGAWLSVDENYQRSTASRDKLSSHRHDFEIMSADAVYPEDIPQPTTGRGRGGGARPEEEWKSLPVIYIGPRSSGNRAISEGGIPRVRDYKVTDEGTDERTKGSRCSRAIR